LPLPEQAAPSAELGQLTAGQLSMADVERQVLLNNPDLRTARAQHAVAQAQMLQASLLPNPSLNGSIGYLISGVGDATAWTAGISENIQSLVTLRPRREAARAQAASVDATLLWEEWQVIGKARLLVVDIVEDERLLEVQHVALQRLEQRSERLRRSIDQGNSENLTATPDLAAAADARASLDDLQRQLLSQRHALAALMGLAPDTVIPLQPHIDLGPLNATQVRRQAETLAQRRPDLIALQLGYRAQEAQVRAAILAQFPPLSFGYSASQDNSRVRNGGPAITFDLPIFDRNQGNIAIERATRQQLHDEYTVRLQTSRDEVLALLAEHAQLDAQRTALVPLNLDAEHRMAQADSAWHAGLIDIRSYVDMATAVSTRQAAMITLEKNQYEGQVALATLLGAGMPDALPHEVTE
jgi:outer membrane protein TolC